MDTYQNPSLLGFQILLCLDFICFFAWISGEPQVGEPLVKHGFQKSSLHGFQNPSVLGFEILLCLDFSILLWISQVFLAWISIRLVTWGATNQDMLLYRKSRVWGCYKPRHVTKRDVLVLATLRYLLVHWFVLLENGPKIRNIK